MSSLPRKVLRTAVAVAALTALCLATVALAIEGVGTVNSSSLRMRQEPSNNAQVVDVLSKNTDLVLLSEADGWYKVLHQGTEGFLAADHVELIQVLSNAKIVVDGKTVTVRKGPASTCEAAGVIKNGTVVDLTGFEGDWLAVSWNGIEGYVNVYDAVLTDEDLTPPPTVAELLVETAQEYLGCRYVYGAVGPKRFDCSGYTMFLFEQYGIELPHSSRAQRKMGTAVSKNELQIGDLVFFLNTTHVGIYIGDGQFIHASTTNYNVTINSLTSGYWSRHYSGACRILTE